MRIVVTGGSGNVGRYVVQELKASNHTVTVYDTKEPQDKDVEFARGNVLAIDDCRRAFRGNDAVIHLAAIPDPTNNLPEIVFNTNTTGTFNVHQAAADLGIIKVVHASSDSSYGFVFKKKDFLPQYLPFDEDHPQDPQDPYGLSKEIGEEIARSFTNKYGMATIALRICFVWFPERASSYRVLVDEPARWKHQFWLYNDARDAALAFRLAVEAENLEHEVFLISAVDNGTRLESGELIKTFYGNKIPFKKEMKERQSFADWSKASRLLGYQPRHTWQELIATRLD